MIIDPTKLNRQGNDVGIQYRTGIYWTDEETGRKVREIVSKVSQRYPEFYTETMPLQNFTPAEEGHQKYLEKNPNGYCHISYDEMRAISDL